MGAVMYCNVCVVLCNVVLHMFMCMTFNVINEYYIRCMHCLVVSLRTIVVMMELIFS